MDTQSIINIGAGTFLAVCGWVLRELWGAIKELRKDIHIIEVELPEHYVRKEDFTESMREIRDICRQIFEKIDNLQQKKLDK